MQCRMANQSRLSGRFYRALHCCAALSIAVGLLPACGGRTGLLVEEEPPPPRPDVECPGWPEDFFLTYAHNTRANEAPTGLELYSSQGDGRFGAAHEINLKEPFAGVVVDDFDADGALEIHWWGLSRKTEYILDYSCLLDMWIERPLFGGDMPPRHEFSSFGDVNNDGAPDLYGYSGMAFSFLQGKGDGEAGDEVSIGVFGPAHDATLIFVAPPTALSDYSDATTAQCAHVTVTAELGLVEVRWPTWRISR